MEIQCASFKVEQNPYQTESVSSHTNGYSFDNYASDRGSDEDISVVDITNALCMPLLNVKTRFISKVSLKNFEEAANVLYNNPFSWCFWLNKTLPNMDLAEYMDLYSSKNMILNFIIETCSRRNSFVCDRDILTYKYCLLPYKIGSLLSNVFDEATQLSSGFASLPDLLFEVYLDTTCDWEALVDSFLEVPALIDEEKWREIGCKISSSLEELSLGLSFNITAVLQFLGSLVQQILISGKHPRSIIEWIVSFSLEMYRHIFDHEILFEEDKIQTMIKATISLTLVPFSFIESDNRTLPSTASQDLLDDVNE